MNQADAKESLGLGNHIGLRIDDVSFILIGISTPEPVTPLIDSPETDCDGVNQVLATLYVTLADTLLPERLNLRKAERAQ